MSENESVSTVLGFFEFLIMFGVCLAVAGAVAAFLI